MRLVNHILSRNVFNRVFACILTACLAAVSVLALTEKSYADTAIDISKGGYTITSGGNYTVTGSTTSHSITVNSPSDQTVYLTLNNVSIQLDSGDNSSAVNITGSSRVVIYLEGENRLKGGNYSGIGTNDGRAGLEVSEGTEVTILGNGSLEARGSTGDRGAAGIGSDYDKNCGKITIGDSDNCPIIQAYGSGNGIDGAAGIGSGFDGLAVNGIYIKNGTITAEGNDGAAGIGGGEGYGAGSGGKCSNVHISGGTVVAKGGDRAPGIGGGDPGSSGEGGNTDHIIISGGSVEAQGGEEAAGIGGSKDGVAQYITISGGTIEAYGGKYGAGIGAGNAVGAGSGGTIGYLTITGGTITAQGGYGAAGIGGGDESDVIGLVIDQSSNAELNITAKGGYCGAGIGNANTDIAGNPGTQASNIDTLDSPLNITLRGGTINATGGEYAAGIGSGSSKVQAQIDIRGWGDITAIGKVESCAIGSSNELSGDDIVILGESSTQRLNIDAKVEGNTDAAVIGSASANGGDITIRNANLELETPSDYRGAAIGGGPTKFWDTFTIGDIVIENCKIRHIGYMDSKGPSIGSGSGGFIKSISINNTDFKGGSIGGANHQANMTDKKIHIAIRNSVIDAEADKGGEDNKANRAAIGSGCYGELGSIVIENSTVKAKSSGGAGIGSGGYYANENSGLNYLGGECGSITIIQSNVVAIGGRGGAGIGGGWGSEVTGNITITDSTVSAEGSTVQNTSDSSVETGSAGIGAGHSESCQDITITGSTVTASGGRNSAGIGCSGNPGKRAENWSAGVHGLISIVDSTVTASGGYGGAGIGAGEGSDMYHMVSSGESSFPNSLHGTNILIEDSTVTATGGDGAAGIGGGKPGDDKSEPTEIIIKNRSRVTATGGRGGAGIGSGEDTDLMCVRIVETYDIGNTYDPEKGTWDYYVHATGGAGAAGIGAGAGGYCYEVAISGLYVNAHGGSQSSGGKGGGAGIGGGSGGKLDNFVVSGGVVEAWGTNGGDAVGSGGNSSSQCNVNITGGTVLAEMNSGNTVIDGGSVRQNITGAKRSDGTLVYRTTMKIPQPYHEAMYLTVPSYSSYGVNDIYSDGGNTDVTYPGAYIYLYLPVSAEREAQARYVEGAIYEYSGTTTADGNGWLKMDGDLQLSVNPVEPIVDEPFELKVTSAGIDEATLTLSGEGISFVDSDGGALDSTQALARGGSAYLKATSRTEYTVKAVASDDSIDKEMYWSAEGLFEGKVTLERESVLSIEDPSKVYDGQPVANPKVHLSSGRDLSGSKDLTFKYYASNGSLLDEAPKNVGTYSVQAFVRKTSGYTEAESARQLFTISKAPVKLDIVAKSDSSNQSDALVTVYAYGVYEPINVEVNFNSSTMPIGVTLTDDDKDGVFSHTFKFPGAPAGAHEIDAVFRGSDNYEPSRARVTVEKGKQDRAISVTFDNDVTYGDVPGTITVAIENGKITNSDRYRFEVVWDSAQSLVASAEPTVVLSYEGHGEAAACDSRKIEYKNAGTAIIKVTVTCHPDSPYRESVAYVAVKVKRAPLTVSSSVKDASGKVVSTLQYGSIGSANLKYGVSPDATGLKNGDTLETAIHGSFAVTPLDETIGVGTHPVKIAKVGTTGQNGRLIPFYSRNYEVVLNEAQVVISPKLLEVSANNATGIYGLKMPELTASVKGLVSWDTYSDVVKSVTLKRVDFTKYAPNISGGVVVPYEDEIQVVLNTNGAAGNYSVNVSNGDLLVEKGFVVIDVSKQSKIYDGQPAQVGASVAPMRGEGFETADLATPCATLVYKRYVDGSFGEPFTDSPSDAGVYLVTVTVEDDKRYNDASEISAFFIARKNVTIAVDDAMAYVGEEIPEFTYTVSGLSDNEVLSSPPMLVTDADMSRAGTYMIAAAGAEVGPADTMHLLTSNENENVGENSAETDSTSRNGFDNNGTTTEVDGGGNSDNVTEGGPVVELVVNNNYKISYIPGTLTVLNWPVPDEPEPGYATCPRDHTCPIGEFVDGNTDGWFHDGMHWAVENDILRGYDDGSNKVGPSDITSRAHVVAMIHRLSGEPSSVSSSTFDDVSPDAWHADSMAWAQEAGIIRGYDDGSNEVGITVRCYLHRITAGQSRPHGRLFFCD